MHVHRHPRATAGLQYRRCLAFSDPVHDARVCELRRPQPKAGAVDATLGKRDDKYCVRHHHIGGYHSDTKLFSRQEVEIVALRDLVLAALNEYVPKFLEANCYAPPTKLNLLIWGWGINMRAGDINFQHVHPDAKVSGVYYVSVPSPPQGSEEGAIMFADPRPRAHMNRVQNQTTDITVIPKAGMMILFPAYYEHAVIPFRGAGVRTCIAFNAKF